MLSPKTVKTIATMLENCNEYLDEIRKDFDPVTCSITERIVTYNPETERYANIFIKKDENGVTLEHVIKKEDEEG